MTQVTVGNGRTVAAKFTRSAAVASVCLLVVLTGCGRSQPTPSAVSSKNAPSAKLSRADAADATDNRADDTAEDTDADDHTDPSSSTEPVSATDESASRAAGADEPPPERFVVITPGGPLVVEITLWIDGEPYDAAMERLVEEVLEVADTDGDGRPTWKEVAASPRFIYGQMGNVPINNAEERRRLIDLYDRNNDGRVNPGEVRRFVTRNNGSGRGFFLRTSNYYRGYNRYESPLRRWIDEDEDGVLSADEIAAAPVRMAMRDADVDAILLPSDFKTTTAQAAENMPRRRRRGPDAAYSLDDATDWRMLHYGMEEVYAIDGPLGPSSFPLLPTLFEELDADQSGGLNEQELPALCTIEPHIRLAAHFGEPGGEGPTSERLTITDIADDRISGDAIVTQNVDALSIELPGVELALGLNDRALTNNYDETARMQFAAYDGDSNGYLDPDELPAGAARFLAPFEALDADGDKKVYPQEIAAFLVQRQAAVRSQIHATIGDQEDALFFALDTDNDGRLTAREIDGADRRLRALMPDGATELSYLDIPGSIAMIFARGEAPTDETLFEGFDVKPRPSDVTPPRWFTGMDANADGDVSPDEFPGTVEDFERLDADRDGFIEPEEAVDASAETETQTTSDQ